MRKVFEKFLMILLGGFVITGIFFLSCSAFSNTLSELKVNIWNKVSTDELNPGEIIALDMSKGYSACDGPIIYIVVRVVDSEEEVVIAFPNGGYWTAPEADPFLQELQREFDSLEEYLKQGDDMEWKKE